MKDNSTGLGSITEDNRQMPPISSDVSRGLTDQESDSKPLSDNQIQQMRKWKQLFDEGIISEEEYNRKKAEILGL